MSDCSTQAMTPKELPRTCGTCSRYYNVRPYLRHGACALDELDNHGCAPIHNEDDEACGGWRRVEMPLEQRCQQLEQVAKNLLGIAHAAAAEIMFPSIELVERQKRKLVEMGVSLDE